MISFNRSIYLFLAFLSVSILIFVFSCSDSKICEFEEYLNYKWGIDGKVFLENGNWRSYTHYDADLQMMDGDTLIPFTVNDSFIIVTHIIGAGNWEYINEKPEYIISTDTIVTDTFVFDFKNFNGYKLILFKSETDYPLVFNLMENKTIRETNHINNIEFNVAGFTIGDTIDRDLLEIDNVFNYGIYSTEEGKLKSNNDIKIELIGGLHVLNITQSGIKDYEMSDIIQVVNAKLGIEPKHTPLYEKDDYEHEFYSWSKYGVKITLQKSKYIGKNSWRSFYSSSGWTLFYKDKIKEMLLISEFLNTNPKSTIIN